MSLTARAVRTAAAITITCAAALVPGTALAAPGGLGTPVPSAFRANSLTWLSAQRGWALGTAPCGTKTCSDVIGTTDGGTKWSLTGTVKAPLANIG